MRMHRIIITIYIYIIIYIHFKLLSIQLQQRQFVSYILTAASWFVILYGE
jgi:hypothetical protein